MDEGDGGKKAGDCMTCSLWVNHREYMEYILMSEKVIMDEGYNA